MTTTYPEVRHSIADATEEASSAPTTLDVQPSKKALWAGRILSGLAVLFLLFDAIIKLLRHPAAAQGSIELGYPESVVPSTWQRSSGLASGYAMSGFAPSFLSEPHPLEAAR